MWWVAQQVLWVRCLLASDAALPLVPAAAQTDMMTLPVAAMRLSQQPCRLSTHTGLPAAAYPLHESASNILQTLPRMQHIEPRGCSLTVYLRHHSLDKLGCPFVLQ